MTYENIHSYTNKKADIFTYEKPALLVVDMQKGFCYPGKQFYSSENIKLVPAISTLLEYFRGNNLPVYRVRLFQGLPESERTPVAVREGL